ncbi:MAG: type II secretory pathway component GspD/PulD (secretin) [Planctomycetota bacterium]|jgi:type II secretory pathway component GspD/PulD (secretin)
MRKPKNRFIVLIAFLLVSCAGTPIQEERRIAQEDMLIDRAAHKGWIDFAAVKSKNERRGLIKRAMAMSRSTMAPFYDGLIRRSKLHQEALASVRSDAAKKPQKPQEEKTTSKEPEFNFEFRDSPIEDVCYLVGEAIGLNILVSIDMPETVTASFPNIDAKRGLDAILARYGYRLTPRDGIHTVERQANEPMETRTFNLRTGVKIDISTQLKPLAGAGGQITMMPENRAVIVTASHEGLKRVGDYLKTLDRRPRQVVIEALVVEVARSNTHRRGVDFSASDIEMFSSVGSVDSNFLPAAMGAGSNPFTLGIVNAKNAIEFMLSADDGIDKLNILHSPFISTLTGKKATLRVIETIPYIQATTSIGADAGVSAGTVTSAEQIEFEETGVTLEVTPNIGDDDIVEIWVKPTIEELVGFMVGVPVIDTRTAETNLMVKNGETVVMGGLLRNTFRRTESGVPILKDIPIIGELFRRVEIEDEKIELMIFLTPHIIGYGFESDPGNNAQEIYLNEKAGYGGVKKVIERSDTESMRLEEK